MCCCSLLKTINDNFNIWYDTAQHNCGILSNAKHVGDGTLIPDFPDNKSNYEFIQSINMYLYDFLKPYFIIHTIKLRTLICTVTCHSQRSVGNNNEWIVDLSRTSHIYWHLYTVLVIRSAFMIMIRFPNQSV